MSSSKFHVVLVEPEIPNNTGNIGRTCVAATCDLHLIGKLGFEITDTNLKRAGLDYWQHLSWYHHASWEEWLKQVPDSSRIFLFTAKAKKSLFQAQFQEGDWLVFGKETEGLSADIVAQHNERALTIPQYGPVRSLNLANAVTVAVYEAIRQIHFPS
ncbi:MAG: tRNA (cytidine(34)-2'-O)-methyltransferase [Bdellovibrionales bacterium]